MKNLPSFVNQQLFEQAFVHRSYLNETREHMESNERLEFLGDSILSFIISNYLYRTYPEFNEGILTNLRSLVVNTKSLAESARSLEFGKLLKLSHGEEESKGRENESLLANSFEAFLGALFIDQGVEPVEIFLREVIFPKIDVHVQTKTFKDPKSLLQEYVQSKKQPSPLYKVIGEDGPPHAKHSTIGVFVQEKLLGEGEGKSKQEGEENAAKQALEKLRNF
jgi:ribonuclease-3